MQKIDYSILNSQSNFNKYVNSGAKGKILITEELLKINVSWLISFSFSVGDDDNWVKVSDRDKLICSYYSSIQQKINAARLAELDRLYSNISHSIKNIIGSSIIAQLNRLKEGDESDSELVVEKALKGADMIRRIIDAMNSSATGSFEDFEYDATHLDDSSTDKTHSLSAILLNAIYYSIGNLFEGRGAENLRVRHLRYRQRRRVPHSLRNS